MVEIGNKVKYGGEYWKVVGKSSKQDSTLGDYAVLLERETENGDLIVITIKEKECKTLFRIAQDIYNMVDYKDCPRSYEFKTECQVGYTCPECMTVAIAGELEELIKNWGQD